MSQSDTHGKLLRFHTGYINLRLCGLFTQRTSTRCVICIWLLPPTIPKLFRMAVRHLYVHSKSKFRRSQPRGLRRRTAAARQLRLWVRIPPGTWMSGCCVCYVLQARGLCDELCQWKSQNLPRTHPPSPPPKQKIMASSLQCEANVDFHF